MSLNDVHNMVLQGTYCGVPVAMGLAYKQLADDAAGTESAGRRLIRLWFDTSAALGGPWRQIRSQLTTDLNWECASDAWGGQVTTEFLTDANGLNPNASLPSTHCVQINVPALVPHPGSREGRMYLPGWPRERVFRSTVDATGAAALRTFCLNLLEIDDLGAGQGPRYHLIPHAEYVGPVGSEGDQEAFVPYPGCFIKVLGSRRSDACTAFAASGGAGFAPIVVPPEPP